MTFSFEKPDSGLSPFLDVDTIRGNFAVFATDFAKNHTALNMSNQGAHEAVIFQQLADVQDADGTFDVLFANEVTNNVGTNPQLFARVPVFLPTEDDTRGSGNQQVQMTYDTVNTAGPLYQSFWPNGYVVYFGQTTDITVPIVLTPAPTRIVIAIASAHNMTTVGTPQPYNVATNILSADTFKIDSNLNFSGPANPYLFTWIAVGVQ